MKTLEFPPAQIASPFPLAQWHLPGAPFLLAAVLLLSGAAIA
ncbi:MAG TPA: hypothetical protein VFS39_05540 [Nitrospira sp.]|nr:hypothetical protein [Nitrospira sp.]